MGAMSDYPALRNGEIWVFDGGTLVAAHGGYTVARPTIQHGLFKRQGGADLYALVVFAVEPTSNSDQIIFANGVGSDVVWPELIPAVIEGMIDAAVTKRLEQGQRPLLGFQVILLDGQTHPVDSRPVAFQMAARIGLERAIAAAGIEPLAQTGRNPHTLVSTDIPLIVNDYQLSTQVALNELVDGALRPLLIDHQFQEYQPDVFYREVNDVLQVVYQRYRAPRLTDSVSFAIGVGVPALMPALGRGGGLLDDLGHYLSLLSRAQLKGEHFGVDGWWSLDINAQLDDAAAELMAVFSEDGLRFFEQLEGQSSLALVESALADGDQVRMGIRVQALLLALNGHRAAALDLIAVKLSEWEPDKQRRWMIKELLQARDYIEQKL